MSENIRLAFQGIWSHTLRSILTMLGVIIGIASIMTIVSLIEGTNQRLAENLRGYYHLKGPIVENEFGQRFYLDNLGKDWLAFRK